MNFEKLIDRLEPGALAALEEVVWYTQVEGGLMVFGGLIAGALVVAGIRRFWRMKPDNHEARAVIVILGTLILIIPIELIVSGTLQLLSPMGHLVKSLVTN